MQQSNSIGRRDTFLPSQPTGRIIARLDQRCSRMRSDGFTPTTLFVLQGLASGCMTLSMSINRRRNWSMHKCFWCIQHHRDDAAWHVKATVERVWMDGESLGATTDRKINHTDELKGFGRGKSARLVISSLKIPTPVNERGDK